MQKVTHLAAGVIAGLVGLAPIASIADTASIGQKLAKNFSDETRQSGAWEGAYVGGSLGYGFDGDDVVGIRDATRKKMLGDIGNMQISGINATMQLGYRWQAGKVVLGPEFSYTRGKISDDQSGTLAGTAFTAHSEVKDLVALRLKTGYLINPDMLIYTEAGIVHANVDYRINGAASDISRNGYAAGLGVEYKFAPEWSAFAAYEYVGLKREEHNFGGIITNVTPSYRNIKIGVNYQF